MLPCCWYASLSQWDQPFFSFSAVSRVRFLKRVKDPSIRLRSNKRSLQLSRYFAGISTLHREAQCLKPQGGYFDVHLPLHLRMALLA